MREINQWRRGIASRSGQLLRFGLLALLIGAAPAHAQRAERAATIQQRVLANGLEVIVVPGGGVPIATVELVVKNGAFTQTPEYAGLAHLFEHMFFKANDAYPEEDAFMDRAARLGAAFNATTREELVNYYVTVVADSVAGGMEFLNAALRGAQFRAEELAREKVVVLGEYDRAESSPWFRLDERIGHQLWGDFWSRKNTIGDRRVINDVTPEQMRTIRDLYYVPNNSALVVAGDVDAAGIFALAERIFGSWPRGDDPFRRAPIPEVKPLAGSLGVIVEEPVNAVTVQIQWHGPSASRDEAATFAADVYSDILNGPASRFQRRLVDSGLWQGVVVNYYTLNHVGPITVSGQTTPEKLREALKALDAELAATLEPGYFTVEELEAVKANRAVTTAFGAERGSENAHTIGFWWSVVGLDYHLRYIDEMAKQTPAQLQAYARRYIVGKPRIVGVMLPEGAKARLNLTEAELAGRSVTP
ncbi:MAG: insulinase family protein [Gemmatimonadaceae bacterium]|jgi:zinc protease|nr:insulinase family protein [Gemmatimonadaceae bacterium]